MVIRLIPIRSAFCQFRNFSVEQSLRLSFLTTDDGISKYSSTVSLMLEESSADVRRLLLEKTGLNFGLTTMTAYYAKLLENQRAISDLRDLIGSAEASNDPDFLAAATTELEQLVTDRLNVESEICWTLYSSGANNANAQSMPACQMEIGSGAGGQEAMLFAAELHNLYRTYARSMGWSFDTIRYDDDTSYGGLRSSLTHIHGKGAFPKLRFEAGVHRVQRVPVTEKGGRIHTSTASVAVLPKPKEVLIEIAASDLKQETMRSKGAGGQHVNTTNSAIRITHRPTGIVIESQKERSQHQNRADALQRLKEALYQREYQRLVDEQGASRKLQIGTKDRSLKVRTYNFLQDRITDHRIKLSVGNVPEFMQAGPGFRRMLDSLSEFDVQEYLDEICDIVQSAVKPHCASSRCTNE